MSNNPEYPVVRRVTAYLSVMILGVGFAVSIPVRAGLVDDTKHAGREIAKVPKKVGRAAKQGGKAVGQTARAGGRAVKEGAKEVGRKVTGD